MLNVEITSTNQIRALYWIDDILRCGVHNTAMIGLFRGSMTFFSFSNVAQMYDRVDETPD